MSKPLAMPLADMGEQKQEDGRLPPSEGPGHSATPEPASGLGPDGRVSHDAGHTPLPWEYTATVHADRKNIFGMSPTAAAHVGTLISGSKRKLDVFDANAAFIVRACNSHYELLEALSVTTSFLELEAEGHAIRGDVGKAEACMGQAKANRALLAKAGAS